MQMRIQISSTTNCTKGGFVAGNDDNTAQRLVRAIWEARDTTTHTIHTIHTDCHRDGTVRPT